MLEDCNAAGIQYTFNSAYRSLGEQKKILEDRSAEYEAAGYDLTSAYMKARQTVALPGTSEHHLGLAVDIVDWDYQLLDEGQEDTAVQKWLLANSWRYGFILRYPTEKTNVTGIIYEPWHYRYVGKERAKQIYDSGLCLEEWLATP